MKLNPHTLTAFWLVVSATLLTTLIPGGPIENRDFSHIHPGILTAFNVFLTGLDLGSLPLAYFVLRRQSWALQAAFVAAVAYFGVYAVDLAQLFPRSPTPMSFALASIEVLGMTVAVPLMFASRRALHADLRSGAQGVAVSPTRPMPRALVTIFLVGGLMIVWFATDAAMSAQARVVAQRASVLVVDPAEASR